MTNALTHEPKKGTLTRLRADDSIETMVGEFYINRVNDPQYLIENRTQVMARRRGGSNWWYLCIEARVLTFNEGEGWS